MHKDYFLCKVLMHLAQARARLVGERRTHWRFGYFLTLQVGLNLPRSLTSLVDICDPLPQIAQVFAIPGSRNSAIFINPMDLIKLTELYSFIKFYQSVIIWLSCRAKLSFAEFSLPGRDLFYSLKVF